MATDIDKFVHDQLSVWPSVAAKYRALKSARTRTLPYGGTLVTLQSNPGRMPVFDHGCPLCEENYMEHQHTLPFTGRKGRKYNILVNRAPIFPNHLVITRDIHVPQTIWHRYPDMLDLAAQMDHYVVFYNSPNSGTTVPQHAHFQACPKGYMPLERATERLLRAAAAGEETPEIEFITAVRDARLFHYKRFNRGVFLLSAKTAKSMAKLFYRLLDCLNLKAEGEEPRFNAFCYCSEGEFRSAVTVRRALLPSCNFEQGDRHFSLSPAAADMAGFVVVPEADDFDRITPEVIRQIYEDITLTEAEEKRLLWRLVRTQPRVEVGILDAPCIRFEIISDGAGPQEVSYREGKINYNGALYDELVFEAATISTLFAEPSFILRQADGQERRYAGTLKFQADKGKVQAVNILGAEDYLLSIISAFPADERKERAVTERTRLMRILGKRRDPDRKAEGPALDSTPDVVTWTVHRPAAQVHPPRRNYDVDAADPVYLGLGPAADVQARQIIDEGWGQVSE